ncbi:MAG: ankyrin repeat domain-containing protein, partial [Mailhella sp.]|nr:ankyrin repeat domain-containing protein [Mailhella sp.]
MKGDREAAGRLLKAGAFIDVRTTEGFTPLFYAAMYGDRESFDLLTGGGASVDARDGLGHCPLHYADPKMVPLLLKAAADIQDAVDVAIDGVTIVLQPNDYPLAGEIRVEKPHELRHRHQLP